MIIAKHNIANNNIITYMEEKRKKDEKRHNKQTRSPCRNYSKLPEKI